MRNLDIINDIDLVQLSDEESLTISGGAKAPWLLLTWVIPVGVLVACVATGFFVEINSK